MSGSDNEKLNFERKRKISEMVKRRFARFGEDVLGTVFTHALQPAQMKSLLTRLELGVQSADVEEQLDEIQSFVARFGAFEFMDRLKVRKEEKKLGREELLDRKLEKIASGIEAAARIEEAEPDYVQGAAPDPRAKKVKEFQVDLRSADLPSTPYAVRLDDVPADPRPARRESREADPAVARREAPRTDPAPAPAPVATPSPVSKAAPEAAPELAPEPPPRTDLPWIKVAGYEGYERRTTFERRLRPDRRKGLEATNSNKRFGGDRRKTPKGRRKEDRTRPDRWWMLIGEKDQDLLLPFLRDQPKPWLNADKSKGGR